MKINKQKSQHFCSSSNEMFSSPMYLQDIMYVQLLRVKQIALKLVYQRSEGQKQSKQN